MTDPSEALARLLSLVQREVSAEEVSVAEGDAPPSGADLLAVPMGHNRYLVARFATPPGEPAEILSRMEALASSFHASWESSADSSTQDRLSTRAPVPEAL